MEDIHQPTAPVLINGLVAESAISLNLLHKSVTNCFYFLLNQNVWERKTGSEVRRECGVRFRRPVGLCGQGASSGQHSAAHIWCGRSSGLPRPTNSGKCWM